MQFDLSAYPHDDTPIPLVKVALCYLAGGRRIRLDVFGDCFPGRSKGVFQHGFLLDSNLKIWDANRGPLRSLRMLMCMRCDVDPSPFSITMDARYLEFVMEVIDHDPGIYCLASDEIYGTLNAIRSEATGSQSTGVLSGVELLPYQKEALAWMRGRTVKGKGFGLMAMEPGLGKTVVTLAYIAQLQEEIPYSQTLVICPASVIGHWVEHAVRLVPSLKVAVISGTQAQRVEQIRSGTWDLAITSVRCAQRDVATWAKWRLECLVFDEITAAKGRASKIRSGVRRFNADRRFGLSGTPIMNSVRDLHSLFSVLDAGYLGTVRDFNKAFFRPIEEDESEFAAEALKHLVAPHLFRRLKQDVLDLPTKTEREVRVVLGEEQMALYREEEDLVRRRLQSMTDEQYAEHTEKMKIIGAISRLRQIAVTGNAASNRKVPSKKLEVAMELADSLLDEGHAKVVIFSLFVEGVVDHLQEGLAGKGIASLAITGTTPLPERADAIKAFASDPSVSVMIISSAAGMGIDLHAADCAIILAPWWNHSVIQQAVDRIHRIGQESDVTIYHLIADGTIEERMLELQDRKWDVSGMVLRQSDKPITKMSRTELIDLLGGSRKRDCRKD